MRKICFIIVAVVLLAMTSCGSSEKTGSVDTDENTYIYSANENTSTDSIYTSDMVYFRKACVKSEYEELYSEAKQLINKRADAINKLVVGNGVNRSRVEKVKYDEKTEGEAYLIDGVTSWKEYIETLALNEIYSDSYIKDIVLDKDYQYRSPYKEYDDKLYYVELAFTGSNGPINGDSIQLYKITDEKYWCVVECVGSATEAIPVFLCQISKCEDGEYRIVTEGVLYFQMR